MMEHRIVFMGTPDFAVPSLLALHRAGYHIVAVVTQPDKRTGRKQILSPSPVKVAALALNLPLLQPVRVRHPEVLDVLEELHPDVIVTAAYGQLLPQRLLELPRVGCLNVHASLLPRWRGAAPIHRALMAGDKEMGVTIMEMVLALDAGPMVSVREVVVEDEDTLGTMHDKLAQVGVQALLDVLPDYLSQKVHLQAQPDAGVTYANRIERADEWIDWQQSCVTVFNHIRGLSPWPVAYGTVSGAPVKVWRAQVDNACHENHAVGSIILFEKRVLVSCIDGYICLAEVQPAGKKRISASEWYRGMISHNSTPCFDMPAPERGVSR